MRWFKAGFIILAVLVSLGVNIYLLFFQSIRLDEAQSIWVATKTVPGLLKINGQDVQTPLYPLLVHFWIQIFGTDIGRVRILSFIFFILTLPFLYRLIREVSTRSTALLGLMIFSLSPFILWYSQEARTYTLLTFAATASNYYYLKLFDSRGRHAKLPYYFFSLIGIYSHYFFIFLIGSQFFYLLAYLLKKVVKNNLRANGYRRLVLNYFLILILLGLSFAPWIYYVYRLGLAGNTQPLIARPTSFNLLQIYFNFIIGFQNQTVMSLIVSLWPLLLTILFFAFTRKIDTRLRFVDYFITTSFLPVALVFLLSFYRPIFLPRYLIFVTPSLFTILAWMLINFGQEVFSSLSILLIFLMLLSVNLQDISQGTLVKEDYRQVSEVLESQVAPQDIIVLSAPFTTYPMEYYYHGSARLATAPSWNRYVEGPIPPFSLDNFIKQVSDYAKVYYRLFLVLSYDQGYQTAIVDYMDHHYQLLQNQKFPANINLRVYQLRYDPQLQFK